MTTGRFQVGDFADENSLFETVFKINPSEIITLNLDDKIYDRLQNDYYITDYSLPTWQKHDQIITDHFKTVGTENFGIQDSELLQKVSANLLSYLNETQKSSLGHIRNIEIYKSDDYMLLDQSTIRNLELFNNQQTGAVAGSFSYYADT